MADEWFEFATADHFWMQWRHRLLVRALKRAGDRVRNALEIGCGHGVGRDMLERDLGIRSGWLRFESSGFGDGEPRQGQAFRLQHPGPGTVTVRPVRRCVAVRCD